MERLTARNANGSAFYKDCFSVDAPCGGGMPGEDCAECGMAQKQCDRLAAYEDTGLTPEQIKQLAEDRRISLADEATAEYLAYLALGTISDLTALAKAQNEGRMVVLPCKVGDTVWNTKFVFSYYSEPSEEVVDRFVISDNGVDAVFQSGYKFSVERFGKTVFLTRAEAEAALKGENNV